MGAGAAIIMVTQVWYPPRSLRCPPAPALRLGDRVRGRSTGVAVLARGDRQAYDRGHRRGCARTGGSAGSMTRTVERPLTQPKHRRVGSVPAGSAETIGRALTRRPHGDYADADVRPGRGGRLARLGVLR